MVNWPRMLDVVLPGSVHRNLALLIDGKPARVRRDGDAGLNDVALGVDDAALRVLLERAVARIAESAVRHLDLEPAVALNGDVERIAGLLQRALRHQARRADGLNAGAELDADRQDVALVGGLRADALHVLIEQVLKLGALALEAGGRHVGDIAGDDLDLKVHGRHAGCRSIKRTHLYRLPNLNPYELGVCDSCDSALRR